MSETRVVRVLRKWQEAEDIFGFELGPADDEALPPFSAGSHIDVHLPGGMVRQYSLCNHVTRGNLYEIGVLRENASRGGSRVLCDDIVEGDVLAISEPRNHFQLYHSAERSLLFAGGIGITPILCMAERLASAGRMFEMHYCTRTQAKTAYLARIRSSGFADKVSFHFDDAGCDQALDLASALAPSSSTAHLYVCGPAGFLNAVRSHAQQAGWPEGNIHFEYFAAPARVNAESGSFEVVAASSGKAIQVGAEESVVAALQRHGIEIPVSCEQGVCGMCLTRVLEGEPDHRDYFLSDGERALNDQFTPCCSRSKSPRLVLDI